MSDIFISYANEDRRHAKMLANALHKLGWSVWWDRELAAGSRFEEVIEQELGKARCVIVLWSATSIASGWVRDEAREGNRRKILVPARIEPVDPPMGFRGIHTADLTHWGGDPGATAFRILCRGINDLVGMPGQAQPTEDNAVNGAPLKPERTPARADRPTSPSIMESAAPAWRFDKRWLLGAIGIGAGTLIIVGITWLTSVQGGPQCKGLLGRPLRVGVVTWPGYAGGIVANNGFKPNKGCIYYQKRNLCVEFMLMDDVEKRSAAFAKGGPEGVDIVWSTVESAASEFPDLIKTGVRARVIMQVDWSRGADAIVADTSIIKIEDLAGKKVSVTTSSPSLWLLEWSLQNSSLDENQQDAINKNLVGMYTSPDARAEFIGNRVPVTVLRAPDVEAARQKRPNSHVLISTREARKLIADVMIARADFIDVHPDAIEAFISGWLIDGTERAIRDPNGVARLLMENEPVYKGLGVAETKNNLSGVHWATLADNTEMFNLDGRDPQPLFDQIFNAAGKTWQKLGTVTIPISSTLAKDDAILRKIYNREPVARVLYEFEPASPEKAAEAAVATAQITVNFPSGRADLDAAARAVIDDKVSLIPKTFSGAYIRVEGNTENIGETAHNMMLSRQRAQAVVDYLVTRYNFPRTQFIAVGNGPDKPVADDATEEGRAKNRRTDISIVAR